MHSLENTNDQSSSESADQQREKHIRNLHQKDNILKRLASKRQEETDYSKLSHRDKEIILLNSLHMKLITNNLTAESLLTREEIVEYYTDLGTNYYERKEYEEARAAYKKAVELEPKNAVYHNKLGDMHYELEEYGDARAAFLKAVELEPKNAVYHANLGAAHYKLKEYGDARAAYKKAAELEPKNAVYHANLANTHHILKEYHKAYDTYRKATELDPKNAIYYNNMGAAADNIAGWTEEALAAYQQAINLNPHELAPQMNNKTTLKKIGWEIDNPTTSFDYKKTTTHKEGNKEVKKISDAPSQLSSREISQIRETVEKSARDLSTIIKTHPSYQGFPTTDEAILMLCGYNGEKELNDLSKDEWLYLEGIVNGTKKVLDHHKNQSNKKLTGQYLVEIQKSLLPKETIVGSVIDIKEMPGFRNIDIEVTLNSFDGSTNIAYKEWKEQCKEWNNEDNRHILHNIFMNEDEIRRGETAAKLETIGKTIIMIYDARKIEQLDTAATYFFEACDKDIQAAKDFFKEYDKTILNDEIVWTIARTGSWLGKGQLFNDANSRTTSFGIVPELLLKYGQKPMITEQKETSTYKARSIGIIYGGILYRQQRLEYYKSNNEEYKELIKNGTFDKNKFEEKFHEERKKREENFKNLSRREKQSTTSAYKSFNVYKKMIQTKRKINKITGEQLKGNKDEFYLFAKEIGKHIEDIFIDRNYSIEASMESMYKVNTKLGGEYKDLEEVKDTDSLFDDLCILYERIQNAIKKAKKTPQPKYLTVPETLETVSTKSYKSKNSSYGEYREQASTIEKEEYDFSGNISRRGSLQSGKSQQISLGELPFPLQSSPKDT